MDLYFKFKMWTEFIIPIVLLGFAVLFYLIVIIDSHRKKRKK